MWEAWCDAVKPEHLSLPGKEEKGVKAPIISLGAQHNAHARNSCSQSGNWTMAVKINYLLYFSRHQLQVLPGPRL